MLKPTERNTVYTHLAAHLPVSKETLMKRARKLLTEQHDDRLRQPITLLREGSIATGTATFGDVLTNLFQYFLQL